MTNVTLFYTARGGATKGTGLAVSINIYKTSDATQVITNGSMTEIGSTGEYSYTYNATATETYLAIMNCGARPSEKRVTFTSTSSTGDSFSGSGWAETNAAYELSGLTSSDISTSNMANLCERADLQAEGDVLVRHRDVLVEGGIDGSRTQFRLPIKREKPLADVDRSSSSSLEADSAADIEVYGIAINSATGFDESTDLTVSSINSARDGRFTLSSAPATTNQAIRCNYSTIREGIKFQAVRTAASYLAAHFALIRIMGEEIPAGYTYKVGRFKIEKGKNQSSFSKLLSDTWNGYMNGINKLNLCPIVGA